MDESGREEDERIVKEFHAYLSGESVHWGTIPSSPFVLSGKVLEWAEPGSLVYSNTISSHPMNHSDREKMFSLSLLPMCSNG